MLLIPSIKIVVFLTYTFPVHDFLIFFCDLRVRFSFFEGSRHGIKLKGSRAQGSKDARLKGSDFSSPRSRSFYSALGFIKHNKSDSKIPTFFGGFLTRLIYRLSLYSFSVAQSNSCLRLSGICGQQNSF